MPKLPDAVTRNETEIGPMLSVEVQYGGNAPMTASDRPADLPDVLRDLAMTGGTVAEPPTGVQTPDPPTSSGVVGNGNGEPATAATAARPPGEPYQSPSISHLPTESGRLSFLKPTAQETKMAELMQQSKPGKPLSFYIELLRKRANSDGRTSEF